MEILRLLETQEFDATDSVGKHLTAYDESKALKLQSLLWQGGRFNYDSQMLCVNSMWVDVIRTFKESLVRFLGGGMKSCRQTPDTITNMIVGENYILNRTHVA